MPKFIVTDSSYFQPFTYDELARPVMESAEMQRSAQDVYDDLGAQTEAIRHYISEDPNMDVKTRKMYEDYLSRLQGLQENLWDRGYNAQTRRDLALARRGFASDINRIAKAIDARQKRSEAFWEAKHKNPDMIMGKDPGEFDLDSYLGDDTFGQNWYSYDGKAFEDAVYKDSRARASEFLRGLQDPKSIVKNPALENELTRVLGKGFTNAETLLASDVVDNLIDADEGTRNKFYDQNKIPITVRILSESLINRYNSTGIRNSDASESEKARLRDYGKAGWSGGIMEPDVKDFEDPYFAMQQKKELMRYQHGLTLAAQDHALNNKLKEIAARRGASGSSDGNLSPGIVTTRGNALGGITDRKQAKDFGAKKDVYDALTTINELKKAGALRQPNGALSDAASKAVAKLYDNPYYKELSAGKSHYLTDTDLDSVLKQIGQELNSSVYNDHMYTLNIKPTAASNIARNIFKTNIGQLSSKKNAPVAEAVAEYSNGAKVKSADLMKLLEANNLSIGFDAKRGKVTVQRNASDSSESAGKYDDRTVYLDPHTVLYGTSAYANLAAILGAFDEAIPDGSVLSSDKERFRNQLAMLAANGETVDLRQLADVISANYTTMMKNGSADDRIIYNALVDSFAFGLYDSGNTMWSPNDYKEGWGAKTGGEYDPYSYGYDYED